MAVRKRSATTKTQKGTDRQGNQGQANQETVATLLKQLKQMKQVCVDIHGGDEEKLLHDIKQRSREDVLANTRTIPDDGSVSKDPIQLEEINELMPLNLNGKIKSRQTVYGNIETLLKRSELRKRQLLLSSPLDKGNASARSIDSNANSSSSHTSTNSINSNDSNTNSNGSHTSTSSIASNDTSSNN